MRMFSQKQRILIAIGISFAIVLFVFVTPSLMSRVSNCGGNSAALVACRGAMGCLRLIYSNNGDKPIRISGLNKDEIQLLEIPKNTMRWIDSAELYIFAGEIDFLIKSNNKHIIVVCDKAYDNVPRKVFCRAPERHAVGYSDGSTGLISKMDFKNMNLGNYINLQEILKN